MNLFGNKESKISILKDPFTPEGVERIHIWFRKGWRTTDPAVWSSTINFKNGNTEGSQSFEVIGAANLGVLLTQMEEFMKSLK